MVGVNVPLFRAPHFGYASDMAHSLRLRLVTLVLAVVISLGGIASAFAQRMPTLDTLAIVEAMAKGATASDFCGKDGKSLIAGAAAQIGPLTVAIILPGHCPLCMKIALGTNPALLLSAPLPAHDPLDPGHSSRAPPIRLS